MFPFCCTQKPFLHQVTVVGTSMFTWQASMLGARLTLSGDRNLYGLEAEPCMTTVIYTSQGPMPSAHSASCPWDVIVLTTPGLHILIGIAQGAEQGLGMAWLVRCLLPSMRT